MDSAIGSSLNGSFGRVAGTGGRHLSEYDSTVIDIIILIMIVMIVMIVFIVVIVMIVVAMN